MRFRHGVGIEVDGLGDKRRNPPLPFTFQSQFFNQCRGLIKRSFNLKKCQAKKIFAAKIAG
jgi:hypothetical protein